MRTKIGYKGTPLLISTADAGGYYETAIFKYYTKSNLVCASTFGIIYDYPLDEKKTFKGEPYFTMRHASKEIAEVFHKEISEEVRNAARNHGVSKYMPF